MDFRDLKINVPSLKRYQNNATKVLEAMKNANTAAEVKKILLKFDRQDEKVVTDFVVISILYSIDTTNPAYKEANDKMDEISPAFSAASLPIIKEILKKPFRADLEELLGKYLLQKYENSVQIFDEKIIPELVEESKLSSKYSAIVGGAQIEYEGKIYNLSQLGKFAESQDPKVRHDVAKLSEKFWHEHSEEIGKIYDDLVHVRDRMAKKLGYKNYIELGYKKMGRVDYNADMVAAYREQIYKVIVPVDKKLYKRQADRLGLKNPDYYEYNIKFKTGNAKPIGDPDFLVKQAEKMYDEMSPEIGTFFHSMVDSHCLDLVAKPGKMPGGYMTQLPAYKMPFVFSNFNGTAGDIDVLTHEIGHAFQYHESCNMKIPEYQQPGMESCEIHSMSMEFLAWPWIKLFVGDDQEAKYRYAHLADAIEFLPYGATVDEFQHFVYANVDATHAERCAKWHEIEKKYMPWRKFKDFPYLNEGIWWLRQGHIFASPFYYIDYTLAQVVAFQFLADSMKNREKTWKKYVKLCKLGGRYPFRELLAKAHLRDPFTEGTMKKNVRPLIKILNSFDDKNM
jgi:M3 family oligoendopeptidase